jgi:hypothetical protein
MPRSRTTRDGTRLKPDARALLAILRLTAKQQALHGPTNLDIALFLGTELTKMMIRMTVTESAPFRCRQGAKQRMVS